jgi:hypothetical protein
MDHFFGLPKKVTTQRLEAALARGQGDIPLLSKWQFDRRRRSMEALIRNQAASQRGAVVDTLAEAGLGASRLRNMYGAAAGATRPGLAPKHLLYAGLAGAGLGMMKNSSDNSSTQGAHMSHPDDNLVNIFDPRCIRQMYKFAKDAKIPGGGSGVMGATSPGGIDAPTPARGLGGAKPPSGGVPASAKLPALNTSVAGPAKANLGKKPATILKGKTLNFRPESE